ncbi:MAG: phasin family protein, partial [Vicinamibacterales bacterium]
KTTTISLQPRQISESMFAVSRQMWLAGLGAAVVTREWVQKEAGATMKSLVREGAVVESRAIRFVGDQIEASMTRANSVWMQTRRTVESTVKQAAETSVALAQQVLPRTLPRIALPGVVKAAKARKPAAKRAHKAIPARKVRVAKKAKRGVKRVTKS